MLFIHLSSSSISISMTEGVSSSKIGLEREQKSCWKKKEKWCAARRMLPVRMRHVIPCLPYWGRLSVCPIQVNQTLEVQSPWTFKVKAASLPPPPPPPWGSPRELPHLALSPCLISLPFLWGFWSLPQAKSPQLTAYLHDLCIQFLGFSVLEKWSHCFWMKSTAIHLPGLRAHS